MTTSPKTNYNAVRGGVVKMIHVGDYVEHNFSKIKGIVKDIRKDPYGYDYRISWISPDYKGIDEWYQEDVLDKIS